MHLAGVTLAVPGIVDVTTDILRFAPNLGWREVPLIELLSRALGRSVPMAMDNEATLGALAEYRVGQFAGTRNLLYVIGEVGIGAGLVIDGSLVRGASGFAGEAGHMQVDPDGPLCRCGSRGCLETYIGLWPLLRAVVPDLARSLEDDVNLGPKAKVAYAVARAGEGDKRALAAFEELGRWLGRGLGNLVNLLNPQVVILGGHFIDTSPFVLASAVDELRATAMSAEVSGVRVVPSTLGFSPSYARPPFTPPNSSRSTRKNALIRSPWPKTRSWSYFTPRCPLRSMWKSFPASQACATPCMKFSPAICSCATSGFTPTISG